MIHVSVLELVGALLVGAAGVAAVDSKQASGRAIAMVVAAIGLLMAWIGRG